MKLVTRFRLFVAGAGLAVFGLALFAQPSLATQFGVDRIFVYVAGGAAALFTLVDVTARRRVAPERTEFPVRTSLTEPGEDLESTLHEIAAGSPTDTFEEREAVHDRLSRVAIRVIARRRNCSSEEARRRLDEGTWTDDPDAAAFFAADPRETGGLIENLRESFSDESQFERRARRAAAELAALEGER